MSRQNSHMFSLKKKPSLIRTADTKSWPQRANTYKLNLFITETLYFTIDFFDILLSYCSLYLQTIGRRFSELNYCIVLLF